MTDVYHVTPINDLREHEVSASCWCRPVPDDDEPNLFLHKALDQRELVEEGKRLVQ